MKNTGNKFFDNLPEAEKEKYKILFEPKDDWYKDSNNTINHKKRTVKNETFENYKKSLKKFIGIQKNNDEINLSFIHFANFSINDYFPNSKVEKNISFVKVTFNGEAMFGGATFKGEAMFGGATFSGLAWFSNTIFSDKAKFHKATFRGNAWFSKATFSDLAWFYNATFNDEAIFSGATFKGEAMFGEATFSGLALFDGAIFEKTLIFTGAKFKLITIINIKAEIMNCLEIKGLKGKCKEI